MATERELSDFLKSVEKRAFKRSVYHVRDEEAALDIVQDSMMKLAEHYGDKPPAELPHWAASACELKHANIAMEAPKTDARRSMGKDHS